MWRLVVVVVGVGEGNGGEEVEADQAVGFGILDRKAVLCGLKAASIGACKDQRGGLLTKRRQRGIWYHKQGICHKAVNYIKNGQSKINLQTNLQKIL